MNWDGMFYILIGFVQFANSFQLLLKYDRVTSVLLILKVSKGVICKYKNYKKTTLD